MRLEYLAYIIEVNRQKSISKAAKKLFITQPSLSIAISNIEEEVGFSIFDRSTKGVILTKEGEKLIKHAEKIIQEIDNLKNIAIKQDKLKTIEIGAVPFVCNSFMIDLVEQINVKNLAFKLIIKEFRNNLLMEDLAAKNSYIGIGCFTSSNKERIIKKIRDNHLNYEVLFEDQMMAFLSHKDILSYEEGIETNDLIDRTPILFEDNEVIVEKDNNASLEINHNHYIFSDKNSIKIAIARNLGYAILPSLMALDDLYIQTELIKAIPLLDNNINLSTILIYDPLKMQNEEKLLIEEIKKLAKKTKERLELLRSQKEDIKSLSPMQIYY